MRDRHNLWTNHNIELLLWSLVLFLILAVADDVTKHAFDRHNGDLALGRLSAPQLPMGTGEVAKSPELGN